MNNLPQKRNSQPKPLTRTQLIKQETNAIQEGSKTVLDVGLELQLHPDQISFCQLYSTKEFFANGVGAYCTVYGLNPDDRQDRVRASAASKALLRDPNICTYLNIILDLEGLNDSFVDKELLFLITQNDDLRVKVTAIKAYNELKNRAKEADDLHATPSLDYTALSNEELNTLIRIAEKANPVTYITNGNPIPNKPQQGES